MSSEPSFTYVPLLQKSSFTVSTRLDDVTPGSGQ